MSNVIESYVCNKGKTNLSELLEQAKWLRSWESIRIHCDTRKKARALLNVLDNKGYKWNGGASLIWNLNYRKYGIDTCYNIDKDNKVTYEKLKSLDSLDHVGRALIKKSYSFDDINLER